MRLFLAVAALVGSILTISPATALAAAPYAGMQLAGTLTTGVDTANAYVGQPVYANHVFSENNSITSGRLYGHVSYVQRASQGRPAKVGIVFDKLVTSNGASYAVDGVVTGVQTQTKNNTLKEVGGAIGGMLVGNMIGKAIFHMAGGGLLGAAGGFLLAKNNRQNIVVGPGTPVRVTLRSVRRQAG